VGEQHIGVLGASGLVGSFLIPLLAQAGHRVTVFSRRKIAWGQDHIQWQPLPAHVDATETISNWISLFPIWVLPEYSGWLKKCGAKRLVALSSTSCFVKARSEDRHEREVARRLADGESFLRTWGAAEGVDWIILRPTLIYGDGNDKNISEITAMVNRLGFFPLLGQARGKRQPVHAQDVAAACAAALNATHLVNRAYNLTGGEVLTYREMIVRVFAGLGRKPVLPSFPGWMFVLALSGLRVFPRYRHWTMAMVHRMNHDLVFDSSEAVRDFGYAPREQFHIKRYRQ
jgi:nucleoside-diphosphate-sugar epimerase